MRFTTSLQFIKTQHRRVWPRRAAIILFVLLSSALMTLNLDSAPPIWWDEGWNLTVARNWIELGHYGRLLSGETFPDGLSGGFTTVAPAALSFRLFGVGIWQGRLPYVFYTLITLAVMYSLVQRLYNSRMALITLLVLLFLPTHHWLHPIYVGRQVLGEIPSLFFLLVGYSFLLSALRGSSLFLIGAVIAWGLAMNTKQQVMPFLVLSLLLPGAVMVLRRKHRAALIFGLGLLGSILASQLLGMLQESALQDYSLPRTPIPGLLGVTAVVLEPNVRFLSVLFVILFGFLSLIGVLYVGRQIARDLASEADTGHELLVRFSLLTLCGSWLAWFMLLSVGWPRYFFPVAFLAAPFVALFLHDSISALSAGSAFEPGGQASRDKRKLWRKLGTLGSLLLVTLAVFMNLHTVYRTFVLTPDVSVLDAARYLNEQTPPDSLVETYESELLLLLDRPYRFPPDSMNVLLIERTFLGQDVEYGYDPLIFNPDYLVVGEFGRYHQIYDAIVADDTFDLVTEFGQYTIYERKR